MLAVPDLPVLLSRQLSVIDEKLRMFADRKDQADAMLAYLHAPDRQVGFGSAVMRPSSRALNGQAGR